MHEHYAMCIDEVQKLAFEGTETARLNFVYDVVAGPDIGDKAVDGNFFLRAIIDVESFQRLMQGSFVESSDRVAHGLCINAVARFHVQSPSPVAIAGRHLRQCRGIPTNCRDSYTT